MLKISSMVSIRTLFLFVLSIHLVQRGALLSNLLLYHQMLVTSLNLLNHQQLHLPLFLLTCQIPLLCLHRQHPIVFIHPCQPHLVILLRTLAHNLQIDYINSKSVFSIQEVLSINYLTFNLLFIPQSIVFTVLQRHGCLILYLTLKFFLQIFRFFVKIEVLVEVEF